MLATHPNLQTTHDSNFYICHRTLFSDYSDQSLTIRSPERGFSTSITLALHLAQPHCALITNDGHLIWHYISNLPQYCNTLYAYFKKCMLSSGVHNCVNAYYKFWTPKAKISLIASKANCDIQRQSMPLRKNFYLLYVLWKFRSYIRVNEKQRRMTMSFLYILH